MPLGMGPLGWLYLYPYWHPWLAAAALWSRPPLPYWTPWGPISKEQEIAILEGEARVLEDRLAEIRKRLQELQKSQ